MKVTQRVMKINAGLTAVAGPDYHAPVILRRTTRQVRIGSVAVGGGAAVSIQTMAKASPEDVAGQVAQLQAARQAGCDIARLAIPNLEAAARIREVKERSGLPIVADIHFDHRLAVAAAEQGADALRINPGNLTAPGALRAVAEAAGKAGIPVRVGVNAGSLPHWGDRPARQTAENMVAAAERMVEQMRAEGCADLKVSLKAFDLATTVAANRLFAERSDLPLHLGLTEAGPPLSGAVRSAAALGILLFQGIGDTVRISLSAAPEQEVRVARVLLRALGLRSGPVVVSCPTCGRTGGPVVELAERVEHWLERSRLDLVVAVMGCEVNGPGEARAADIGIAFGPKGSGLLFERGTIIASLPNSALAERLLERLEEMAQGRTADGQGGMD